MKNRTIKTWQVNRTTKMKAVLFFISLFFTSIFYVSGIKAQTYLYPFAGNGIKGYAGEGGSAQLAELNFPTGIFVDKAGNAYIADQYNNRICKVSVTTGTITWVAGDGTAGYSGDSALAKYVDLYNPSGVWVDTLGHIFIADCYNHRIRKVDTANGWMYTIAGDSTSGFSGDGGPAANAKLSYPSAICMNNDGDIFFIDYGNDRIRKITAAGTIVTVAGNGVLGYGGDDSIATNAKLLAPSGICIDNSGNLYIADEGNNRIRMVNITTGIITTVVGNGVPGFLGDGASAKTAELNGPQGVFVDAAGNIYIADANNNRIREVNTSGIISTVVGNGTAGYYGNYGLATNAELNEPVAVFVNQAGNIFIADKGNSVIRKTGPYTYVNQVSQGAPFSIYPNPAKDNFVLSSPQLNNNVKIEIITTGGKKMYNAHINTLKTEFDISSFPQGNYLLNIYADSGVTTLKLTVKR
jgi:sugar lactone lactonase YvrE